jgi:hypothetical protein
MNLRALNEEKASFLAQKVTRAYLETNLDEAAKNTLAEFAARKSIVSFYKAFFAKHASVYGCSEPVAFSRVSQSKRLACFKSRFLECVFNC